MCGEQFNCKSALINANFSISENEAQDPKAAKGGGMI
jgi:hypothetical protein